MPVCHSCSSRSLCNILARCLEFHTETSTCINVDDIDFDLTFFCDFYITT